MKLDIITIRWEIGEIYNIYALADDDDDDDMSEKM